jgi:hypothetical protein
MIQAPLLSLMAVSKRDWDTTKVFLITFMVAIALHSLLDWWAGSTGAAIATLSRDIAATPFALLLVLKGSLAVQSRGKGAAPLSSPLNYSNSKIETYEY